MRRTTWYVCAVSVAMFAVACRAIQGHGTGAVQSADVTAPTPLILSAEQGERRVRRTQTVGLSSPFILKVDGRNGGSPDLVMGYEDIAPGQAIAPHRHLGADEIIFVQRGSGVVELGTRTVTFTTGATIYIPKHIRVAVRNTGSEPVTIAFMFSKPGFEQYLRETSVPEGAPVAPMSVAERAEIRARHQWHTLYDPEGARETASSDGGLVLQAAEGERRVRRTAGKGPFILKVDRKNGASQDLVMGYEDIAPGAEIQPHTHLVADEILFIHRGTAVAKLGQRESVVSAGGTIYIPRHVQISVRNTGTEPLGVAFVFSKPGFEELMRDNSVLEGQPVVLLTPEERDAIRKRNSWHTISAPPPQ